MLTIERRFKVLERDHFTCQYCGMRAPAVELHVDHVVPISQGGTDDMTNLVTSCLQCNLGKASRPLAESLVIPDEAQENVGSGKRGPGRPPKKQGDKAIRVTLALTRDEFARLDSLPGRTRADRVRWMLNNVAVRPYVRGA